MFNINLFINKLFTNTLNEINYIDRLISDIDIDNIVTIIEQQYNFSREEITNKIIIQTSYQLPYICICFCMKYPHNQQTIFQACKNIYNIHIKQQKNYILFDHIYAIYIYVIKYCRRNNQNLNIWLVYKECKQLFVFTQLTCKYYIEYIQYLIPLSYIILFLYNQLVHNRFVQKEKKFFINIILESYINILIYKYYMHNFQYKHYTENEWWHKDFFDLVISNWNILYSKHKQWFKKYGLQWINFIIKSNTKFKNEKQLYIQLYQFIIKQ